MKHCVASRPSAPECQLSKLGTEETYERLLRAARDLSEKDLQVLEDDIAFYAKTGLIGVGMSKMLTTIDTLQRGYAA
jgi:hypothetical protein